MTATTRPLYVAADAWPVKVVHADPNCHTLRLHKPRIAQNSEVAGARICRSCGWRLAE